MRSAGNGVRIDGRRWLFALVGALSLASVVGCGGAAAQASRDRLTTAYAELANPQPNYAEISAAADEYLQAAPDGPHAADALYLRGRALEEKAQRDPASPAKDFADAYSYYAQAAAKTPRPALEGLIRAGMGNVLYFQDRYAQAITELTAGYEKLETPDSKAWALYRIGLCQQRLGRWGEADGNFALVQQEYPNTVQAQRAREKQGAKAFWVQVGAYPTPQQAEAVIADLKRAGTTAARFAEPGGRGTQYVRVGPMASYDQAVATKGRLDRKYAGAAILP